MNTEKAERGYSMKLEEIKNKRQEAGLSQQALAGQIGISRATLSLIENGKRKPSYDVMCNIAKAFNEPVEII